VLFFRKSSKARLNQIDIEGVRRRVQAIRQASGEPASLADLFAMLGESDIARAKPSADKDGQEPKRVLPDQVPSTGSFHWE
jgi:hypothetical protein